MKRVVSLLMVLMMVVMVFAGCTQKETDGEASAGEKVTLTFMINHQSSLGITEALEEAVADFENEYPDITVDLVSGISDYEAVMKTRMGANDLPDLWATHGWSVARYSEYLRPLTDQEWAGNLNTGIEKVITDENGDIFVLPVDMDLSGIVYNKDVIETAGVDVDAIETWDDFLDACQQIKDAGFIPVHMGGKDHWTVGNFYDWAAPSYFVTNDADNDRETLKDGSFDWSKWDQPNQLLLSLDQRGFLNEDKLSSTYADSAKNLASGTVGFEFFGNYAIAEALRYNEQANLAFMPVPSAVKGDGKTLISGERNAFGIWKDTEHEEEALLLLNYFARPEVMTKIATASALPAGLKGVESDTGMLKPYYEQYENLRGFPYFDRAYLPSGMWETIESTSTGLLAGDMTSEEVNDKMKTDYDRLINQ